MMRAPFIHDHVEFCDDPFRRGYRIVLFFTLFALCAFLRLYDLGSKSMMHDELLFTNWTYYNLYETFNYYYQPILHGPLMLHLQNLTFHIFGVSDYTVRLAAALLGVFSFFWVWKLRYWLGEAGTWFCLLFFALSPGIAFFHRFFHQDSLYLFCTLWIIASLANWWRTRNGAWAVSAILAIAALFNNKASAVFVYFTILTFLLLIVVHDLAAYILQGKARRFEGFLQPAPRFPGVFWPALCLVVPVILVLAQVFEGLRYESGVTQQLGHDWLLRDVHSIPLLLGWTDSAGSGGGPASRHFWVVFYTALFSCAFVGMAIISRTINARIGHREFLTALWGRVLAVRWYLVGAIALSAAFYLAVYTTFFEHKIGFFEIYANTWAYWGGQHEIGRIAGPFHQHMLNLVVYELPAVLIILGAWICGLFRTSWTRTTGLAFLLMAIPFAAFHKLIFSGLGYLPLGDTVPVAAGIGLLRSLVVYAALIFVATLLFPRSGRVLLPLAFVGIVISCIGVFSGSAWADLLKAPVYRNGAPVEMMGRQLNLRDFMEIQFNLDGGTSLTIVLLLIFFATIYTWSALDRGERFRAFAVWWFVTMLGSASYAREAVPQVGIHAMMPAIVLAGLYVDRLFIRVRRPGRQWALVALIGLMALWNLKATANLNFRNADDPRERMAYGPSSPDVKAHMKFVEDYVRIAPLRFDENNRPVAYVDYNDVGRHKDVRIYIKTLDQVTWPAKWYLREIEYEQGNTPEKAIQEGYDFLFLAVGDDDRYPELKEHYNIMRGRGTSFWTPDQISGDSLMNVWKEQIPGHYLDFSPQAAEAFNAKRDWKLIWRYLILRETFDGTGRTVPSVSSFEYLFCYRKELF